MPESVLFNADASRVVSYGPHALEIRDASDGKPVRSLHRDGGFAFAPALGPDGHVLAVAERGRAGALRVSLLSLADGRRLAQFDAAPDTRGIVLGPDARYAALLGAGRTVDVLDPRSGRKLLALPEQHTPVRLLAAAGSADELVSIDDEGEVYEWRLERGAHENRRRYLGATVDPASASLAADGGAVAFEAEHGRVLVRTLGGPAASPYRIDSSADAVMTRLAPDGMRMLTVDGGRLRLWRTSGGGEEPVMDSALSALAIDRGGGVAALGFRSGNVRVRRPGQAAPAAGGARDVDFIGHRGAVTCLAVDAAGGRIASGGEDGVVRVWDLASAAPTPHFLRHPEGPIHAVAISRDGKWIASAAEYSARVWEAASGKLVGEVPVNGAALSVAFSPQDDTLAVGDSAGNIFFGAPRGSAPLRSTRTDAAVTAVAFSRDGHFMASGDRRGDVQLWNAADGTAVSDAARFRHPVTWLGFGADGSIFVRSGDWIHQLRADGRNLTVRASRLLPLGFDVDAAPAAPVDEHLRIFGIRAHGPAFYTVDMNAPAAAPLPADSALLQRDWAETLGLRFDRSTGTVSAAP
jgi:WD40 repeat protein